MRSAILIDRFLRRARSMLVAVLVAALGIMVAGCDSSDTRATARVARVSGAHVCLVPEDRAQRSLKGCFPFDPVDRGRLRVGACVDVRIPNQLERSKRDDPVEVVGVLERACR